MKVFLLVAGFLSLCGCAVSPEMQQLQRDVAEHMPTCNMDIPKQCTAMWEAAQVWVVQNSAFKLQIATDVILETYAPPEYDGGLAVRVVKEPTGPGSYRFNTTVYCNNLLACHSNQWVALRAFQQYVTGVKVANNQQLLIPASQ